MPLIYGPTEMTNPQPKNFVTPSRTTGIYVQNVSPLALIITSGLGSIELPPWQTATLEAMPNDNLNVSAIPITAVPPSLAAYAYVDISYTFQGVTVQGSGLFFPFMTPGGDAVAAGIMGPDGLQVGTSTSNPNNSSLLTQLTGSSAIIGGVLLEDGNQTVGPTGNKSNPGDGNILQNVLQTMANLFAYNGTNYDRVRVSNGVPHSNYSAGVANNGSVAIWTPTAGKRFRALSISVYVGAAGAYDLADGVTNYNLAFGAGWNPIPLPPNGWLSGGANNTLQVVNATGAAQAVAAIAFGTEE